MKLTELYDLISNKEISFIQFAEIVESVWHSGYDSSQADQAFSEYSKGEGGDTYEDSIESVINEGLLIQSK